MLWFPLCFLRASLQRMWRKKTMVEQFAASRNTTQKWCHVVLCRPTAGPCFISTPGRVGRVAALCGFYSYLYAHSRRRVCSSSTGAARVDARTGGVKSRPLLCLLSRFLWRSVNQPNVPLPRHPAHGSHCAPAPTLLLFRSCCAGRRCCCCWGWGCRGWRCWGRCGESCQRHWRAFNPR